MKIHSVLPVGLELTFTIQEAVDLINCHVVHRTHIEQEPELAHIGFIAGLLTLNDEVELLVKFMNSMEQVGKRSFEQDYRVIEL